MNVQRLVKVEDRSFEDGMILTENVDKLRSEARNKKSISMTWTSSVHFSTPLTAVPIPFKTPDLLEKLAFTIDNVYSKAECDRLIELSESIGYEPALVNIGNGNQMMMTDVRNNHRFILDNEPLAEEIIRRIEKFIPETPPTSYAMKGKASTDTWRVVGLNERLRFLRYDSGQKFEPHFDGCYIRTTGPKKGDRSFLTIQLYLNEGFVGGETTFLEQTGEVHCVPKTGMVLIFEHDILHQGSALVQGRKYVIRSDIMYSLKTRSTLREDSNTSHQ